MIFFNYFDPGLGALIAQAFIAIIAGVSIFWKTVKAYIKSLFGQNDAKDEFEEMYDDETEGK